ITDYLLLLTSYFFTFYFLLLTSTVFLSIRTHTCRSCRGCRSHFQTGKVSSFADIFCTDISCTIQPVVVVEANFCDNVKHTGEGRSITVVDGCDRIKARRQCGVEVGKIISDQAYDVFLYPALFQLPEHVVYSLAHGFSLDYSAL